MIAGSYVTGLCWHNLASRNLVQRRTFAHDMNTGQPKSEKITNLKPQPHPLAANELTLKHRETHGCVVSTVATDALVLKHQAISILSTD